MTTVKEFRDLGVEYVDGDVCREIFNKHWWKSATSTFDGEVVTHFAWRTLNTMPDRPRFLCDIDYENHAWRPSLDQSGTKAGEPTKPVFTQEMADMQYELGLHKANSELLATLTDFMVKNNIVKVGESCIDVAIRELSEKHNIDTRTPKQKAVDEAEKVITNKVPTVSIALAKAVIGALYDAELLKR